MADWWIRDGGQTKYSNVRVFLSSLGQTGSGRTAALHVTLTILGNYDGQGARGPGRVSKLGILRFGGFHVGIWTL